MAPPASLYIGEPVLGSIRSDHLDDILTSEQWRRHLSVLSDAVGFGFSVFSRSGSLLLSTSGISQTCRTFLASPLHEQCSSSCNRIIAKALERNRPVFSKCYARTMAFAIPLDHLGDRAVILGRGSFATYRDFRTCLDLVTSSGIDSDYAVAAPLRFTSYRDARKVCAMVLSSASQFLQNAGETLFLKRKMETLKDVVSRWGASSSQDAATVYEQLMTVLFNLFDLKRVTIFAVDERVGSYAPLFSRGREDDRTRPDSLPADDPVVRMLQEKKAFISVHEPAIGSPRERRGSVESHRFFPLWMNGKLEGIVGVICGQSSESDTALIKAFCTQAMLTIENHRLYADLYRKFDRFAAISEVAQAITPIRSYSTLIQSILDKSADLLKAERGSLMLLDQETDGLLLEAKRGTANGPSEKMRIPKGEGFAGMVAEMGEPLLVENVEADPRTRQKNRRHYKTASFVSVPLKIGDRTIGVLNLSDKTTGDVFNEEDLRLIQSFASHAAVVLERNVLFDQAERLRKLSITDPLTGLLNRRYLQDRLDEELARSSRYGHRVSVMMLDIDGFKTYNDTRGHQDGDALLKRIADAIMGSVRTMDIVSRFGGDEFVVILPETEVDMAAHIAERIRTAVEALEATTPAPAGGESGRVTMSIGVVSYPGSGDTIDKLLGQADKALYHAKSLGKNRIEVIA